jgi:transporter family protein
MTALFGKISAEQINSDMATFIRTVLILILAVVIVALNGGWQSPATTIPKRSWIFLVLSGMATGASWLAIIELSSWGQRQALRRSTR